MKRKLLVVLLSIVVAGLLSACGDVAVMEKEDLLDVISSDQSLNSSAKERAEEKPVSSKTSVGTERVESETDETSKDEAVSSVKYETVEKPKKNDSDVTSKKENNQKIVSSAQKNETAGGNETKPEPIGREKAKKIAFSDANVEEKDVFEIEIDLDRGKKATKYEVDFKADGKEYEYDIDVYSGKILLKNVEEDNVNLSLESGKKPTTSKSDELISKADAKAKAFLDAGVDESKVRELEIESDSENGTSVYEIEFKVGKTEYKYEINAQSGKITDKEIDKD